jgi:hypothetical protein
MLFNIEHWHKPKDMTSATECYEGQPLGPMHAKTIERISNGGAA